MEVSIEMVKIISIDFDKAMRNQLTRSLELSKYKMLIDKVHSLVDINDDEKFKKAFDGFYKVRRNDAWRKEFFLYFNEIRLEDNLTFERIITDLNQRIKDSVEPSFSSKMLATITPEKPIWDSRVLNILGLTRKWEKERTVENAIRIYDKICDWYDEYLKSDEARNIINMFDCYFPDYNTISDVKKIDYLLWCIG